MSWPASAHDGAFSPPDHFPIAALARELNRELGGTPDEYPGTLFNLWNAEHKPGARLIRWVAVEDGQFLCKGFFAYGRISEANLALIEPGEIKVVPESWYVPDGPVAFITEAMAFAPGLMVQAVRLVSELPGVHTLCCWRRGRFRVKRARR